MHITAQSCANALLRTWVSRFGVPASLTDRGAQFTSSLWAELTAMLGISRVMTTSYHPQSNGMVERLHRTMKERLMARACATGATNWMDYLPFVLLGLRTTLREDSKCSPAQLVFGGPLRLPGDLVELSLSVPSVSASDFSHHLHAVIRCSAPMSVLHHGSRPQRVDAALQSASHVLLRVDAVRRPLVPPYEGPFEVLERNAKTFIISRHGKSVTISIDRLKPAYVSVPQDSLSQPAQLHLAPRSGPTSPAVVPAPSSTPAADSTTTLSSAPAPPSSVPVSPAPKVTSSGRVSRVPKSFLD